MNTEREKTVREIEWKARNSTSCDALYEIDDNILHLIQDLQNLRNGLVSNKLKELEWKENRREEENEISFAVENDISPTYWCDACKVGVCTIHT